ncbi:MAG TPA: Rieske 2Fe-2S domain-containing protein [Nocardioidaceae bacterium]|nr:Rieske 2Fe-2S domain-containing protein [Nocardioidaceae bacterium]
MWSQRLVEAIENATILDAPASAVAGVLNKWLRPGMLKDSLSGTWLGHAVHPAAVLLPAGTWLSASWLDLAGDARARPAARSLVAAGTISAVPAALTGLSDWAEVAEAERRVGFVHALANTLAVGLYAASWWSRSKDRHGRGAALALTGAATIAASSWLGGHLVYANGVGVDTTAFLAGPSEWTDVTADEDLAEGSPLGAMVGEVPIVVVRQGGRLHALNGRCTHRGAPLADGELVDGCIECPWHGSRFRLESGDVVRGPATRPQPRFEVRVESGRVQVRLRGETHALRLNPVGSGT